MKRKRIWLSLLSVCIILALAVSLCSCFFGGNGEDSESGSESESKIEYSSEPITLFDGSENDYVIVYSSEVTPTLRKAVLQFKADIEQITGESVTVATDTSKTNKETAREIVVGLTARSQSAKAVERLEGVGWAIERVDDKICIVGTNDYLSARALSEIFGHFSSEGGRVTVAGNVSHFTDCSDEMTALITDEGKFAYEIVAPRSDSYNVFDESSSFAEKVEALLNADDKHSVKVNVRYDDRYETQEGVPEILVGKTNREASTELYEDIGYFAYKLFSENGNVIIGAYKQDIMKSALNALYLYIEEAYRSSADGNCYIPRSLDLVDESFGWTNDITSVDGAEFGGIYDPADGTYLIRYTGADADEYSAYIDELKAGGMTLERSYSMGENSYALLLGEEANAYISYVKSTGEIRVHMEKAGDYVYPTESAAEAEGDYTPTLWQLRVDNYNSRANGGMSYVIQLSNGHFIIIDGGYNKPDEAENLYNHLKAHTPEGEKPVIDAWFISHLHTDHYGAFLAFSSKYGAEDVELRALYYNFLYENTGKTEVESWAIKQVRNGAKKWAGITLYEKLHTGMTLEFTGAKVSVVCTHEDVYPNEHIDANDTSTVLRVDIEGQSVIFLGDCRDNQSLAMLQSFSGTGVLSADIVQWSHHGYEGATRALYEEIGAEVILFPLNIIGWQEKGYGGAVPQNVFAEWYAKTTLPAGSYIVDGLADGSIKQIIIAGDGESQELVLPYTPTESMTKAELDAYISSYFETHKNDRPVPDFEVGEVIT